MRVDDRTGVVALDVEDTRPWVQVALSARVMDEILRGTEAPAPGSPLTAADELFAAEPVSEWARAYLAAALQHLIMWADYATPLSLAPGARVSFALRPAQTLARAALESAAQAAWLLSASDLPELMKRHLALVLADWDEQGKAAGEGPEKSELKARREGVLAAFEIPAKAVPAPTYLNLVLHAARCARDEFPPWGVGSPAEVERLWRASAGSAHGKKWPSIELQIDVDSAGRRVSIPDPAAITRILQLANSVMSFGVMRFVDRSGHYEGLLARQQEAVAKIYAAVPKVPGAPAVLPDPPAAC